MFMSLFSVSIMLVWQTTLPSKQLVHSFNLGCKYICSCADFSPRLHEARSPLQEEVRVEIYRWGWDWKEEPMGGKWSIQWFSCLCLPLIDILEVCWLYSKSVLLCRKQVFYLRVILWLCIASGFNRLLRLQIRKALQVSETQVQNEGCHKCASDHNCKNKGKWPWLKQLNDRRTKPHNFQYHLFIFCLYTLLCILVYCISYSIFLK